jgi:hypothetical protein
MSQNQGQGGKIARRKRLTGRLKRKGRPAGVPVKR